MRALLLGLATLALLPLLPVASANHDGCGSPDGSLVLSSLDVWLLPGCQGASVGISSHCAGPIAHLEVLTVTVLVWDSDCTVFGLWLA